MKKTFSIVCTHVYMYIYIYIDGHMHETINEKLIACHACAGEPSKQQEEGPKDADT